MSFNKEDLAKIADLARIGVSESQAAELSEDLTHILKLVEKMNSVDTSNVAPLAHPLDATQPLRQDSVTEDNQRELFQSLAPRVHSGLYIVPKVIESE